MEQITAEITNLAFKIDGLELFSRKNFEEWSKGTRTVSGTRSRKQESLLEEKKQLREEKKQLRTKEEQLRLKEEQLRE